MTRDSLTIHSRSRASDVVPNIFMNHVQEPHRNENVEPTTENRIATEGRDASNISSPSSSSYGKDQEEKRPRKSIMSITSDWFVWEILAMALSLGLLISIVVILGQYNHHAQPAWQYMSLNSLISWLSTFSKGFALFAISETIGQLKWAWFNQKQRPLSDLRTFDSASRGLWGSAELIWTLQARHFAVFSGAAVLLATSFDPFIQNLIHYYPKLVVDSSQVAILGNNSYYAGIGGAKGDGISTAYVDTALKGNVYNAVLNSGDAKPWAIPNYECSTANCTWDPIAALEVTSSCMNVTHMLNQTCGTSHSTSYHTIKNNCTVTLPGADKYGWFIKGGSIWSLSHPFVMGSLDSTHCNNTAGLPCIYFIAPDDLTTRASMGKQTYSLQAMQCTIVPIVRSFRAHVTNGSYHEETLATWDNGTFPGDPGYSLYPPWGPELGMNHNQNFTIVRPALLAMSVFLKSVFNGFAETGVTSFIYNSPLPITYASIDFVQAMVAGNITGCEAQDASKLKCAMENTAAAITKTMRDSASNEYAAIYPWTANVGMKTKGKAMTSMTHIAVHWQWIITPALVWLLGFISLIGVIWKSRVAGTPKWKNDPIPLLFLHEHDHGASTMTGDLGEEDLRVKLYKGQNGCRLSS